MGSAGPAIRSVSAAATARERRASARPPRLARDAAEASQRLLLPPGCFRGNELGLLWWRAGCFRGNESGLLWWWMSTTAEGVSVDGHEKSPGVATTKSPLANNSPLIVTARDGRSAPPSAHLHSWGWSVPTWPSLSSWEVRCSSASLLPWGVSGEQPSSPASVPNSRSPRLRDFLQPKGARTRLVA
jgi:hypothetical protein